MMASTAAPVTTKLTIQHDEPPPEAWSAPHVTIALQLTDNTQAAYLQGDSTERRLLNQAFFERIEIDAEEITDHTSTRRSPN